QLAAAIVRGVGEAVEQPDAEERNGHRRIRWLAPVGDVQLASLAKDTGDLARGPTLRLRIQMVKEESGEHPVEPGVLEGKLVGEALHELELDTRALRLRPGPFEHLRVGVEAHHLGLWLALFH